MKPIYIKMKFFGSYRDVTIDFSKMNSGIFLITGDTGAGKTTIFDAITYALYGESSGGKRDGKMMISQFAAPNEFTEVTFCFQYGKDIYTIRRSPIQKQYKEKFDDNKNKVYEELKTLKKPILELTMPDGNFFDGKMPEINEKIQEIVGIDASQFVQIAMLAQGDFLKLLHASSKDRKEIFAKIFDTSLYGLIQDELKNRFDNLNVELEKNKKEIKKSLDGIVCAKESDLLERWKEQGVFSEDKSGELFTLIECIIDEFNQLSAENEKEFERCTKEAEQIQKLLNEAEQTNKDFDILEQAKKDMEVLQLKKKDINETKEQYLNAQKAEKISGFYNLYKDKKDALDKKQIDVDNLLIKLTECNKNVELYKHKKLDSDEQYNKEFDKKIEEISLLEEEIKKFDEIEEEEEQYRSGLKELKDKQKNQSDNEIEENSTKNQVDKLTKDVDQYREIAGKLDSIQRELDKCERDKQDFNEFYSLFIKKESFSKEIEEQQKQYDKTHKERENKEIEYNQLYEDFINGQAHIIRKRLVEGEPCPVCGSRHHDITDFENVEVVSEQEVKDIKKRLDTAIKEENEERDKLTLLQSRESENNKQISKYKNQSELYKNIEASKEIETYIKITQTNIQELEQQQFKSLEAKNSLKIKEQELQEEGDKLQGIQEKKNQFTIDIAKIKSQTDQMKKALDKKKEKLSCTTKEEAQKRLSDVKRYKNELEKNKKENDANYQQIDKEREALQASYNLEVKAKNDFMEQEETAKNIFFENLTKNGFFTEQEFIAAGKSDKEAEQLNNKITAYEQHVRDVNLKIQLLSERTKDKNYIEVTGYIEQKKKIEELMKKLQVDGKNIYADKQADKKAYFDIKQQYKKREKLNEQYVLLKNLNDTANGKISHKRMDFQTYMQRRYFKKVIDAANLRLIKMTNNQFCLKCRDLELLGIVGTTAKVGLDLDVYSIVNDQIRDVKTLSGGESFMASLSMALGLSDIIQSKAGKIKIQTMFIDEGFGTLSEDVRNQALEILNELSDSNILIGIISHVKELREQVNTKLVVTKTKDGSKAVWKI